MRKNGVHTHHIYRLRVDKLEEFFACKAKGYAATTSELAQYVGMHKPDMASFLRRGSIRWKIIRCGQENERRNAQSLWRVRDDEEWGTRPDPSEIVQEALRNRHPLLLAWMPAAGEVRV